jgi:hypothetical protein
MSHKALRGTNCSYRTVFYTEVMYNIGSLSIVGLQEPGSQYCHVYGVAWLIIVDSRLMIRFVWRHYHNHTRLQSSHTQLFWITNPSLRSLLHSREHVDSLRLLPRSVVFWFSTSLCVLSYSPSSDFTSELLTSLSLSLSLTLRVTTDGQPASLSWNKAPFWGSRSDLYYCLTVAGLLIWGALSDGVCRLQLQLVLASAVIFGSESRRTRGHILLSHIWDFTFRRLLRLAEPRWRYSTPPPYESLTSLSLSLM